MELAAVEKQCLERIANVKEDLMAQIDFQREEFQRREEELMSQVCTEDEAVKRKVEAATSRFKACFAENDSLRAVLDLRSGELRQLRSENAQLKVQIEDMPQMKERISHLEHHIENLEAIISARKEHEKQLEENHRKMEEKLENGEVEKRQMWRACEVLVFQLQNSGISPLSNPLSGDTKASLLEDNETSSPIPLPPPTPQVQVSELTTPTKRVVAPFDPSAPLVPHGCSSRFLVANEDDLSVNSPSPCSNKSSSLADTGYENSCSPGTESILRKIMNQTPIKVAVNGGDSASSSAVSPLNSFSSPRSDASSSSEATSPPPPCGHQSLQITSLASVSTSSTTSGCCSSNEL